MKKIGKIISLLILTITMFSSMVYAATDQTPKVIPKVIYNDKEIQLEIAPVIESGRVFVPMRAIFEMLGSEVQWNNASREITATCKGNMVKLRLGNTDARMTTKYAVNLDVPVKITNGRTLVPLRVVTEALGAKVEWSAVKRSVFISDIDLAEDTEESAAQKVSEFFLTYTDPDGRFSISYPCLYRVNSNIYGVTIDVIAPNEQNSQQIILNKPDGTKITLDYKSCAGVGITDLNGQITLDDAKKAIVANPDGAITKLKIVSEKEIVVSGTKGLELILEHEMGQLKCQTKHILLINQDNLYDIMATKSEIDSQATSENLEAILQSFKFL